jgi:pyruvate kinase
MIDPYWSPQIIAKIEKPQAIEDIDAIIALVTGGIMVARGDLGVEASLENLPLFQKMLIRKANLAEKIVITATQMLESMIEAPTPTRAEVSDVANSVFDGTDAVMLSAESASGKYPIESVEMMSKICVSAESGDKFMHPHPVVNWTFQDNVNGHVSLAHPIADSAVSAAVEVFEFDIVKRQGYSYSFPKGQHASLFIQKTPCSANYSFYVHQRRLSRISASLWSYCSL